MWERMRIIRPVEERDGVGDRDRDSLTETEIERHEKTESTIERNTDSQGSSQPDRRKLTIKDSKRRTDG